MTYKGRLQMDNKHLNDNHQPKSRYFLLGLTLFLTGTALIGVYYILLHGSKVVEFYDYIANMMMPILCGFVLAYVLIPVLNYIERKIIIPFLKQKTMIDIEAKKAKIRAFSVTATAALSVLFIYSFIKMFVAQIVPSIQEIALNFDTYMDNGIDYVNNLLEDNPTLSAVFNNLVGNSLSDFDGWLNNTLLPRVTSLLKTLSASVLNVLGFFWDAIIGFILSIYILSSKDIFALQGKKIIYSLFKNEVANGILHEVRFIHKTFTDFITGKVIDSIIIGIICFIGTSILGTPYAALVSAIVGITNIVPFFGPFLGAIPSAILIFVVAPMEPLHTVYFLIFILLLQQFDGNVLGPKILGDSTGLSSFWVIFAITVFGGLLGIPGMVIGVPAFAVIFAMIRAYINKGLEKKGLPTDRDKYEYVDFITSDNHIVEQTKEQKQLNRNEGVLKKFKDKIEKKGKAK